MPVPSNMIVRLPFEIVTNLIGWRSVLFNFLRIEFIEMLNWTIELTECPYLQRVMSSAYWTTCPFSTNGWTNFRNSLFENLTSVHIDARTHVTTVSDCYFGYLQPAWNHPSARTTWVKGLQLSLYPRSRAISGASPEPSADMCASRHRQQTSTDSQIFTGSIMRSITGRGLSINKINIK